jgi:hypothetical protein
MMFRGQEKALEALEKAQP